MIDLRNYFVGPVETDQEIKVGHSPYYHKIGTGEYSTLESRKVVFGGSYSYNGQSGEGDAELTVKSSDHTGEFTLNGVSYPLTWVEHGSSLLLNFTFEGKDHTFKVKQAHGGTLILTDFTIAGVGANILIRPE